MKKNYPDKLEQTALIEHIEDTVELENLSTRHIVLWWSEGGIDKYLKLKAKNRKCQMLDRFKTGDNVTVTFSIQCKKNNGSFYQNLLLIYIKNAND